MRAYNFFCWWTEVHQTFFVQCGKDHRW